MATMLLLTIVRVILLLAASLLAARMRYSEFENALVGEVLASVGVASLDDCGREAFDRDALGVNVFEAADGALKCEVIGNGTIEAKKSPGIRSFIADFRALERCSATAQPVVDIIANHSPCEFQAICDRLSVLKKSCEENRPEDPHCVLDLKSTSSHPPTTTTEERNATCAANFTLADDKTHCCHGRSKFLPSFQKCVGSASKTRTERSQADLFIPCTRDGALPVTIENAEQNEELKKIGGCINYVIGFYIPEGEPWSKDGFRWFDGSRSNFTAWGKDEPRRFLFSDTEARVADCFMGKWRSKPANSSDLTCFLCVKDAEDPLYV